MSNQLAVRNVPSLNTFEEITSIAKAMFDSGYFSDAKSVAQAVVKIMAGKEMGFNAFASMTGVYIIQGKPSVGANLMASAVKRSPRYDYIVSVMTDTVCEIVFLQDGKEIGRSSFTKDDAQKAGTQNMGKFPRNMLFARAMSNGVRWYCPDVFDGSAVYTPEELGANVNEEGQVIDAVIHDTPMTPSPANAIDPAKVKPLASPAPVETEAQRLERLSNEHVGEDGKVKTDLAHVVYGPSNKTALYGKQSDAHKFPTAWMPTVIKYVSDNGLNSFEVANIMWALNIPQDTPADKVLDLVQDHLNSKAAGATN